MLAASIVITTLFRTHSVGIPRHDVACNVFFSPLSGNLAQHCAGFAGWFFKHSFLVPAIGVRPPPPPSGKALAPHPRQHDVLSQRRMADVQRPRWPWPLDILMRECKTRYTRSATYFN